MTDVEVSIGVDNRQAIGGIGDVMDSGKKLQNSLAGIGGSLSGVGKNLTVGLTSPLVLGLGLAVKQSLAFEEATADMSKVLSASDEVIESMSQSVIKLTREIPLAATELQQISAAGAQMGVAQENLLQFTELVAKAATAFDITAAAAGESVGKITNVFGIGVNESENLLGAINHLSNNMAAKAGEIINSLQRIGGTAKIFGLSAEEAAGLSAAMIALGRPPEVAATGINALLNKMQTASEQSKKFQTALQSLGFSAEDLEESVREKGAASITDFLRKIESLDQAQRPKVLTQLFGAEYQDDISLLVTNLNLLEKSLGLATDRTATASSLQEEFAARSATTANQLQLAQNALSEIGITIGSSILPVINQLLQQLTPLVSRFADFAQANPEIIKIGVAIAGVAAVVGPLLVVLGSVISAISTIVAFLPALGAGFAALAPPIALAVGAGLSLGFLAKTIIENWDGVVDTFRAILGAIGAQFTQLTAQINYQRIQITQFLDSVLGDFGGLVGGAFNSGKQLIFGFADGIRSAAAEALAAAASVVAKVRDYLPSSPAKVGALSDLDKTGGGFIRTFANGIQSNAGALTNTVSSTLSDAFNRVNLSSNNQNFDNASPTLSVVGEGNNRGTITIEFAPTINLDESSSNQNNEDTVLSALRIYERELLELIEEARTRWRRGDY